MTKETKRNNFKRLAETRTRKVLQYLTLLSNLSNKQYYDYSEADYKKISKAIREQLNDMDKKFSIAVTKVEKFRL